MEGTHHTPGTDSEAAYREYAQNLEGELRTVKSDGMRKDREIDALNARITELEGELSHYQR